MQLNLATLAAIAPLALAAPTKRQTTLSDNDVAVLQLAHYLENLEHTLYSGGMLLLTSISSPTIN